MKIMKSFIVLLAVLTVFCGIKFDAINVNAEDEQNVETTQAVETTQDAATTSESKTGDIINDTNESKTIIKKEESTKSIKTVKTAAKSSAEGVHITLTTEQTSYADREYASFKVKYTMDYGKVKAGDKLVITVPDALKDVTLAYSKLHFSACNDIGNGTYELVFGSNAPTGLSGYLSINAYATNTTTAIKTGTITAGDKSLEISVTPTGGTSGGTETRAIEKWAPTGTNYKQSTAVSGIYGINSDSSSEVRFAIDVDPRKSAMRNVIVTDNLADELSFVDGSIEIIDMTSNETLSKNEAAKFIKSTGKNLKFDFGDLDGSTYYRIYYTTKIAAGTRVNITNTAHINYDNGVVEKSDFYCKAADGYGASIGYKQVDKAFITDNPEDQIVTYTITFQNDEAFSANEINLTDELDPRVKYVQSYGSDYFDLSYDKNSNSLKITNSKEIPASVKQVVTIVTDFSDVPTGTTITNTVGGNTVKTKKAAAVLKAKKILEGGTLTSGEFNFVAKEVADAKGTAIDGAKTYTAKNEKDGNVDFDEITYNKAGTYYYLINEENGGETKDGIIYDASRYIATVVVTDNEGVLNAKTAYTKTDGSETSEMTFANKVEKSIVNVPGTNDNSGGNGGGNINSSSSQKPLIQVKNISSINQHPNTGDMNALGMYLALMMTALALMTVLVVFRKKFK